MEHCYHKATPEEYWGCHDLQEDVQRKYIDEMLLGLKMTATSVVNRMKVETKIILTPQQLKNWLAWRHPIRPEHLNQQALNSDLKDGPKL